MPSLWISQPDAYSGLGWAAATGKQISCSRTEGEWGEKILVYWEHP